MAAKQPRDKWVVCYTLAQGPYTQAEANQVMQRTAADATRSGMCQETHEIITSPTKPVTRQERHVAEMDADDA